MTWIKNRRTSSWKILFCLAFTCFIFKLLISHISQTGYEQCNDNHTNYNSNDEGQIWRIRYTFTTISKTIKKIIQKSLFILFVWACFVLLHEILSRYILRMNVPQIRICCHLIRGDLFLKANLIYKMHNDIQHYRSFHVLIMYYCNIFHLFILLLKVHLSKCFETE